MPTQKRHFHNPPLPATVDSVQAIDKGLIKFDQLKAYVTKHVTGTKGGPNTVSVVTPGVLRVLFVNRNKDYLFQITRTYINSLGLKKVICLEPNDCSGAYHMRVLENRIAQKKPSSTHPTVGRATKSGTAASGHPMSSGTPRHGSSSLPAVSDIISAAMSHSLQSVASASSSTAATYSASRVAGTTGVATTATPAVRSSPAAPTGSLVLQDLPAQSSPRVTGSTDGASSRASRHHSSSQSPTSGGTAPVTVVASPLPPHASSRSSAHRRTASSSSVASTTVVAAVATTSNGMQSKLRTTPAELPTGMQSKLRTTSAELPSGCATTMTTAALAQLRDAALLTERALEDAERALVETNAAGRGSRRCFARLSVAVTAIVGDSSSGLVPGASGALVDSPS